MKLNIHTQDGSKDSSIDVDKFVFGIEPNRNVVNQAVKTELTNLRQGTRSSKNRSKVRGGGKKPFKQKGRCGARAGTIRSPLWKGGGTVFGPQPYNYSVKMPKKMRNLARRSVLSYHFKNNNIFKVWLPLMYLIIIIPGLLSSEKEIRQVVIIYILTYIISKVKFGDKSPSAWCWSSAIVAPIIYFLLKNNLNAKNIN